MDLINHSSSPDFTDPDLIPRYGRSNLAISRNQFHLFRSCMLDYSVKRLIVAIVRF